MSEPTRRIEISIPPEADVPPQFRRGAEFDIELGGAGFGDTYKGRVVVVSRYRMRNGTVRVKLDTVDNAQS